VNTIGKPRPPQGTLAIKAAKGAKEGVSGKMGNRSGAYGTSALKRNARR
jgi:hypothetical protein